MSHQSSNTPTQTRTLWLLAAIFAVGLGIRFVHLWFIAGTAFPRIALVHNQSDMYAFWQWAQTIVAGDWLGRDTYHPYFNWMTEMAPVETWHQWWGGKEVYHQAPLYPYFLATILSLKNTPTFAFLVQLIVGALQPLILFFLARRLFDSRVALAAAALTALYGPFVFYQTAFLRDWLPPILEPLILLLILRAKERGHTVDWLLAGMVIGLGVLTKETALAVSGMALVWLMLQYRHAWREARRPLALLSAGLLVCLAPLFARNILVGAPPLAISGQGMGNIIIGFVADMSPVGFSPISERALEISKEGRSGVFPTITTIIEMVRAHQGNLRDLGLHEVGKIRGIIDAFEVWNNTSYYYGQDISPALALTLGYGVIFPLGLAGALVLLPAWRRMGLFYCYLLASVAIQMITITMARFRLSLVPVLILGAAFFLVELVSTMRRRQIARSVTLITLALFLALSQQFLVPITQGRSHTRSDEYILASNIYAQDKRFDLAVLELARLREMQGQTEPRAAMAEAHHRIGWAEELARSGKWHAARLQIQLAENIYAKASDASGQSFYNLGVMYARLGEQDTARVFFHRYLNLHPEDSKADQIRDILSSWTK